MTDELERRITNLEKVVAGLTIYLTDHAPEDTVTAVRSMMEDYWDAEGFHDDDKAQRHRWTPPFLERTNDRKINH